MKRQLSGAAGFSLVEVLVSLAVFLIASMGLMSLLLTGLKAGRRNTLHGDARRLAGEAMAVLQTAEYEQLPEFDGVPSGEGGIQLLRTVESDAPEAGQMRLTVTATWQGGSQVHSYQLQTIRSRP
ncbi:MAG: type II secretion system protein [Deltaproteobacteria bacterium]|nr:MAG: type II secretion system protein [Deltaproteobacteria bacterium]